MGDVIDCSQLADRSRLIMVSEMSNFQTNVPQMTKLECLC